MDISVILEQLIRLFLILCVGALLAKLGILDQHTKQKLTKLMLLVTTPLMILDAFNDRLQLVENNETGGTTLGVGYLFGISVGFYLLLILMAVLLTFVMRIPKQTRNLYTFMTVFGNVGFMGFPVALAVCGSEGLFYAAILNCVFNILIYTVGVILISAGNTDEDDEGKSPLLKMQPKKLLLTPGVLCCAVAVLLFSLKIQLPSLLADTFDTLGGLTSPLAMLVVGANLAGMPMRKMLTDLRLNLYTLIRQFVVPVLMWLVIRQIVSHETLASVLLLMAAMPIANTTALFATEYKSDEVLASQAIFVTTLCSLGSLPLIVWLCNTFLPVSVSV